MKAVNYLTAFLLATVFGFVLPVAVAAQDEENSTASVQPQPQVGLEKNEERYRIGFQDTLEVTVFRHPELSLTVNVAPDGTIRLPRIDDTTIPVVCKTERELANDIAKLYKERLLKNPFVNVRAVEQRSQSFAVIGAVEKPGSFYLNRKIRLLELLAFAGGPSAEKAGTKLIVARTGSRSVCRQETDAESQGMILYQYNIKDVLQGKQDLLMQPGDIVSVLDADVVYVYGNVNKQGPIKLTRPLTLRQAISSAEGFAPASKKDKIRIIRQKEGTTEWQEIVFNLKDIETGKVQDPFLQPNDIVAVSEDSMKSFLENVKKSLTGGLANLPIFVM
jgi:Periplasmic protein involved in polysaccharide export